MRASFRFLLASILCSSVLSASHQPLLDLLVSNGTITQEQADAVQRQLATQAEGAPAQRGFSESAPPTSAPSVAVVPGAVYATPNRNTVSELKIRGRIQGQFAYADGSNSHVGHGAGDYNTFELRRVRLGVQGKIFDDWRFLIEANVLSDAELDSATLSWSGLPFGNVTFGKAKPRFGHEETTSSASILTMERSRLTSIFAGGKPLGLWFDGESGRFTFAAGVFNGHTTSTSRMASDMDSALWNLSGGIKLDDLLGGDRRLRFRLDYLHNESASGYYAFEDALAVSGHFQSGPFDLRAEYLWGESHENANTRGFYVMPSWYFIPERLQGVLRYEHITGDDGVALGRNRYADRIPGLYGSGNAYQAFYAGINYYIHGDNLKLMAGIELAENEDDSGTTDARGRSTTFISGIRMQF